MSDDVPANTPEEIALSTDAAAPVARPRKRAKSKPTPRKRVGKKAAKAPAAAARGSAKSAASSGAASQVQVGNDTIFIPKALAANLTPKDLKKLRAVFKRVRKRGKKRATKKRATKKR